MRIDFYCILGKQKYSLYSIKIAWHSKFIKEKKKKKFYREQKKRVMHDFVLLFWLIGCLVCLSVSFDEMSRLNCGSLFGVLIIDLKEMVYPIFLRLCTQMLKVIFKKRRWNYSYNVCTFHIEIENKPWQKSSLFISPFYLNSVAFLLSFLGFCFSIFFFRFCFVI